jgi:hypothetical protein
MELKNMHVKIGMGEIERILNLKADVDYSEILLDYAFRYLNLGWALMAIDGKTGDDIGIDYKDENIWGELLGYPGVNAPKINLGVHTGSLSGLLVLEVANEEQKSCLDEWGNWRSHCVAELGSGQEKHFYMRPPDFQPLSSIFLTPKVHFYDDGATTLLPPSVDPFTQGCWQWQNPPWERAPSPLPLSILKFLQRPDATDSDLKDEARDSWQKLYCLISPFETVLQAFTRQAASMEEYYEKLFQAALEAGLTDSDMLLSLLWHAPLGDAKQRPERWAYLQKLVSLARIEESQQSPRGLRGSQTPSFYTGAPLNYQENGTVGRLSISLRGGRQPEITMGRAGSRAPATIR